MAFPTWVDAVSVVAAQKLAVGATVRGTFDVSSVYGGFLFIRAMRLGSSAPSAGLLTLVRRLLKGTPFGGTANSDIQHPQPLTNFQDGVTASNLTTLNGAPGASSVVLTSATGFAAGQYVGITDSTTTPTRFEVARSSKIASTTLTLDRPLGNANLATGDTITNNAVVLLPIWVDGTPNSGDVEVIFDLGPEATIPYLVECWGQRLTN